MAALLDNLPEVEKRVRLHRRQNDFCESKALYRGFVGGRGSGKSWVGAFDLLTRARPGRLYLVGAPTYQMLRDATLRTFVDVGRSLDMISPDDVRTSPPAVRLMNGAEVIFRSADDPEHFRGPNLSGVWLDEASLMARAAYDIAIACLREGGEQGWLSATFTPKGLGHWTYEVFGKVKPNTELFHAETRDNPFLPAEFHERLAEQYSGLRADQELKGHFVNVEGAEWPAEYFPDSIWTTIWPQSFVATALALDPAMGHGERGKPPTSSREPKPGCYACFAFAGVDREGIVWVDAWMSQTWDAQALVTQCFELHRQTGAMAVSFETNGGQEFLAELALAESRRLSRHLPLFGINNFEDKDVRIRSKLTPLLAQRRLRFRQSRGAELLVQQCRDFPVGEFKDGPDALQMALVMLDHLLGQMLTGARPRAMRA